jgi:transmembrane sensor
VWAAAAAVMVAVGLGVLFWHDPAGDAERVYATAGGERATFFLSDGTRVTLAPASRLRVAGGYGRHRRAVSLDGEAYFRVVHDASAPFTVRAGEMLATDLGTEFDVAAYATDTAVRVAVADGRVALTTGTRPAVPLARGDVAAVGSAGVATVTHRDDVAALTGWTDGRLDFHNVALRDAAPAIARWYNIDLVVGDERIGRMPVTASFKDEPVSEVLHIIAVTVGARVEHRGRTIVLVGPS